MLNTVINVVLIVTQIKPLCRWQWWTVLRCRKAAGNYSKQRCSVPNNMCNRLIETSVKNRQAIHCHTPQHSTISLSLNGNKVTW